NDHSRKQILRLTAEPGFGKSTICAELLRRETFAVAAAHFCFFDDQDTVDSSHLICSIAFQLVGKFSKYKDALRSRLKEFPLEQELAKGPSTLFGNLLVNPFRDVEP